MREAERVCWVVRVVVAAVIVVRRRGRDLGRKQDDWSGDILVWCVVMGGSGEVAVERFAEGIRG